MSIQGFMNGGQAKKVFQAFNEKEGSEVVDMSRNYNTGDSYATRIGTGNQIDKAFNEIGAYLGTTILSNNIPDYGNGRQLKRKFALLALMTIVNPAPIWGAIMSPQIFTIGETYNIDLNDWCYLGDTYVSDFSLPPGLSLVGGIITGTVTGLGGAGTMAFTATNANGSTQSEWVRWTAMV